MANIRHAFVSGKADGADPTVVKPSDWNAELQYTDVAGVPSGTAAVVRQAMTGNITLYVRTDGADSASRSGLANTAASAFLTPNYAFDRAASDWDGPLNNITIQLQASQTWTSNIATKDCGVVGAFILDLGGGTLSVTGADCISHVATIAPLTIQNGTLTTTTLGNCVNCQGNSQLFVGTGITFGACANSHIYAQDHSSINLENNYAITGGAQIHWKAWHRGVIFPFATTITITGTPNFSSEFAQAAELGLISIQGAGPTFVGSATGTRYEVFLNGVIDTANGVNYLPGNLAGTTATGGQYT